MTDKIITVWKSGLAVPDATGPKYSDSRIAYRGEVITLTPEQIEDTVDTQGNSWLDLTEEEQVARWGEVRFKNGDHSAEVSFIGEDDSTVRFRRRENAVIAAMKLTDATQRREAFKAIDAKYGRPQSTQRSVAY